MHKNLLISAVLVVVQVILVILMFSSWSILFGKISPSTGTLIIAVIAIISMTYAVSGMRQKQAIFGSIVCILADLFLIGVFVLGWLLSRGHF